MYMTCTLDRALKPLMQGLQAVHLVQTWCGLEKTRVELLLLCLCVYVHQQIRMMSSSARKRQNSLATHGRPPCDTHLLGTSSLG